jgi:hypothetical protein
MKSVLQDWVMNITLRQQGVLILALRGPDGSRKEDVAKPIVRALRALVMNSGREGVPMAMRVHWENDPFMSTWAIGADDGTDWQILVDRFYGSIDQYNVHFLQHLWHAFAVVGINHPRLMIRERCWDLYLRGVHSLHMWPETPEQIQYRLRDGIREEVQ